MPQDELATSVYRVIIRRALAGDDPANLQLHFEIGVLERYRGQTGYTLIRTDTVGRLSKAREWSLDFGISPDEDALHATWAALLGLPVVVFPVGWSGFGEAASLPPLPSPAGVWAPAASSGVWAAGWRWCAPLVG